MASENEIVSTLRERFARHLERHARFAWEDVESRLLANPEGLRALAAMEESGGEPDAVARDEPTGEVLFFDCSPESPLGRRSLCYDREALESRRGNKPRGDAASLAALWGARLLTEEDYRFLQTLGEFDLKTSSWVETPAEMRALGGALFCDRRFGRVFAYHNGAESYYAARGFRTKVAV